MTDKSVVMVEPQGFCMVSNSIIDKHLHGLGAHAFIVYCVLVRHADIDGACFPSVRRMAEKCGMSTSTVQKALETLKISGLLQVENRYRDDGGNNSNLYKVYRHAPHPVAADATPLCRPALHNNTQLEQDSSNDSKDSCSPPKTRRTPKASLKELGESFNVFCEAYPRKVAKPAALKAWMKLQPDADLQEKIAVALKVQRSDWEQRLQHDPKFEKSFIPHPATWLNGGRWDDVVEPYKKNGKVDTTAGYHRPFEPPIAAETEPDEDELFAEWTN